MITPSKFVPLDDSVLAKLPVLLSEGPGPIALGALYQRMQSHFESLDQFMLAIDVLYLLEKIDVNLTSGILSYAD